MNWEALTAISTAFTGIVILFTVLFAARQVSALREQSQAMSMQIDHLRRATQLEGALAIFEEIGDAEIGDAYRFVMNEFAEKMKEERFHAEALERAPDPSVHKEVKILRHLERVGTIVKNGLIDADVPIDFMGMFVQDNWQRLEPLVREQRALHQRPSLWENFEYLNSKATATINARNATRS
jgi:uncharacterized protein DUF4760